MARLVQLPVFLAQHRKKAQKLLQEGAVLDVEFSGVTYQMLVDEQCGCGDEKSRYWVFMQLDEKGKLGDAFCSCELSDQEGQTHSHCVHLACAFLAVYRSHNSPLHERFASSLWHNLCFMFSNKIEESELKKICGGKEVGVEYRSPSGKVIVQIRPLSKQAEYKLNMLLYLRPKQNEETSIKFSKLSAEELTMWRRGQPSQQLHYELSFWSDLAKWLMLMQDEGKEYKVSFDNIYDAKPPKSIQIDFDSISLSFYLSEANLPQIIPSLATVKSPLGVYEAGMNKLEEITYDEKKGVMNLKHSRLNQRDKKNSLSDMKKEGLKTNPLLGGWGWLSGVGFVSNDPHHLLGKQRLEGEEITELLEQMSERVEESLKGTTLHKERITFSYQLHFDADWNLHINAFVFVPGDLNSPYTRLFGSWIYLEGDGFYLAEALIFSQPHTVIPEKEVESFVSSNRSWLHSQPGFYVHLPTIDEQLIYNVDKEGCLHFERQSLTSLLEGSGYHEFGRWLYVQGEGFYAKSSKGLQYGSVRSGLSLKHEQVSLFIKMHSEELELVHNFFASRPLLLRTFLRCRLEKRQNGWLLEVSPGFDLVDELKTAHAHFYEDTIYVEGEGFALIPNEMRLPEHFVREQRFSGKALQRFIAFEINELWHLIKDPPNPLKTPANLKLVIKELEADQKAQSHRAQLYFVSELGQISALSLWLAFQSKERYFLSDAGLIDLADGRYRWLTTFQRHHFDRQGALLLSTIELIRLNALERLEAKENPSLNQNNTKIEAKQVKPYEKQSSGVEKKNALEALEEVINFDQVALPELSLLRCSLRPYQLKGLQWLWFLYRNRLSGLLCDDMGLGKTHQSMALIDAIYTENGKIKVLIVCPTSVVFHWREKLDTFLPTLQVILFYGQERSLDDLPDGSCIVLTSYGILRREVEGISKISFDLAVFDEIQLAKNSQTRLYQVMTKLQAKLRIGMSGTPIENYLRELKALFDLVLNNYLPSDAEFREVFIKPIEKEGNQNRRELLKRLIAPFVLRRKKQEVLDDLPEKSEEIAHCSLHEDQKAIYNDLLLQSRKSLLEQLEDNQRNIPYMHIFSLLSALKQVCNHPAVYLKKPMEWKQYQSGKWDLFCELLEEARHSGQKVVVFSQYLHMLDIIASYAQEHGIGFAQIRGSTKDRKGQLQRFHKEESCEIFLASLHAAGTGIDLTPASVVIHYDRWWNAAREDQATDRVHRIGQRRGVQVFKLVTVDTFEERIDALIEQKKDLMDQTIGSEDESVLKLFDRHELIELLRSVSMAK